MPAVLLGIVPMPPPIRSFGYPEYIMDMKTLIRNLLNSFFSSKFRIKSVHRSKLHR